MTEPDPTAPGLDHAAPEDSAEKAAAAKDPVEVAKDPKIVHAPEGIAGGPATYKTGRYLNAPSPDADEVDLPEVGAIAEGDVFVELLDNSATPRYRQVASQGLAYYSPI